MKRLFFLLALSLVFSAAQAQAPDDSHVSERDCEAKREPPFLSECTFDSTHSYDVTYYRISLDVDTLVPKISGNVFVRGFARENNFGSVELDCGVGLVIDSVYGNGQKTAHFRVGQHITVLLPETLSAFETFETQIFYWGCPPSFYFRQGAFFTFTEPDRSKDWFPCYDEPFDKADSSDLVLTVPYNNYVVSNGVLVDSLDTGSGITYHWHNSFPISTYLVSVAGTGYIRWTDWYHSASGDSMPVIYYVLPEESASAAYDFENTVDMISFFASAFGEYPFLSEKYTMASIPMFTAMEHQTCTSYGSPFITGDRMYESIVSHELAHQWWGDWVTLGTWKDMWLNEGFATYSAALYKQYKYGENAFRDRMKVDAGWYFQEDSTTRYAIYDPPPGYLFGSAVYGKGAWVLHMLRGITSDSAFFNTLKAYGEKFSYGNAVTTDFTAVAESVAASELDWFFDQWVYEPGHPEYRYWWSVDSLGPSEFMVQLSIDQLQSNAPIFKMPIEIGFDFQTGDTILTVLDSAVTQQFDLYMSQRPIALRFDPNEWILKLVEETVPFVEEDARFGGTFPARFFPNPSCGGRSIRIELDLRSKTPDPVIRLVIFDATGRVVRSFPIEDASTKSHFDWDLLDDTGIPVRSGTYFCRVLPSSESPTGKVVVVR